MLTANEKVKGAWQEEKDALLAEIQELSMQRDQLVRERENGQAEAERMFAGEREKLRGKVRKYKEKAK